MKNISASQDLKDYLLFMWKYLKGFRLTLIVLLFVILAFIITGRLVPIIFGWAVDFGITEKNLQLIYIYGGLLLICNFIRAIFSFISSYGFRYLGQKVLFGIRKDLISHVHKLPQKFFDKVSSGRIVTRISNDTRSLGDLFSEGFAGIFINLIEIISIIASLFWVAWPLAILVLLIFPPVLWLSYNLSEKIKNQYVIIKSKLSSINSYSAEALDGVHVLQLYNGETLAQNHFATEVKDYKNLQLIAHKLFAQLWPILEFFQLICIIISIAFGMVLIEKNLLTVGEISAFILLLQGFFRPLRYILEKYNQVQNGITSSQRIIGLLKEPIENTPLKHLDGETKPSKVLNTASPIIKANDLSFSYDGKKQILKHLNFEIFEGQKVAIVGRTGSGKTTLVSLLQRSYQPQDGQIYIQNQDINSYDLDELRKQVIILRQEEFLFKGDIQSNIQLGNLKASKEQVQDICNKVQLQFKLTDPVAEMGANLSAGEKQLIALARALLFDPKVVILDEATSHIDSIAEKKVLNAMDQVLKDRTSIIIAHRLSTVLNSDLVIVLEDGRIVEQGTPAELIENQGPFNSFYKELL